MERKLTRREVLKYALVAGVGISLPVIAKSSVNLETERFDLSDITPEKVIKPRFPLPAEFDGVSINAPFLWQYPAMWNKVITNLQAAGVKGLRVFIDDKFEPQVGDYQEAVINQVARLSERTMQLSDGNMHLMVDLFDAYGMKQRFNVNYGLNKMTCPYTDGSDQGELNFYTNQRLRDAFFRRLEFIIKRLKKLPGISCWGVANELESPKVSDGKEIFSQWNSDVVEVISSFDDQRFITLGVKRPWHVDEQTVQTGRVINTVHPYFDALFNGDLDKLRTYLESNGRCLPIICQEIGFGENYRSIHFPQAFVDTCYSWLLKDFVHQIIFRQAVAGGVRFEIALIMPWKAPGHDDNFPDPFTLPKTTEFLKWFNQLVSSR